MTRQPDSPFDRVLGISPEALAQAQAELDDPNFVAPSVEWLDDGPDPFNMEWKWADPPAPKSAVATAPTPIPSPATPPDPLPRVLRFPSYALGAALAASLLIGFGVLLGNRIAPGGDTPLAFGVTLGEDAVRGPEAVGSLAVENRSKSKAFVTVVGVKPDRSAAIHYRENQRFIELESGEKRVVGNLPSTFDDSSSLIVVLTATPAGEAIRQVVAGLTLSAGTPRESERAILQGLTEMGYRGAAAEAIQPVRKPR